MACGRFKKARTPCTCSNCGSLFMWPYKTTICEDCLNTAGVSRADKISYKTIEE